jgi:hypothetical protein
MQRLPKILSVIKLALLPEFQWKFICPNCDIEVP